MASEPGTLPIGWNRLRRRRPKVGQAQARADRIIELNRQISRQNQSTKQVAGGGSASNIQGPTSQVAGDRTKMP